MRRCECQTAQQPCKDVSPATPKTPDNAANPWMSISITTPTGKSAVGMAVAVNADGGAISVVEGHHAACGPGAEFQGGLSTQVGDLAVTAPVEQP